MSPDHLLALRDDPARLEVAYRAAPGAFTRALAVALDRDPEALVLQAWAARLDEPLASARPAVDAPDALSPAHLRLLLLATIAVTVAAGTWAKLPALIEWIWVLTPGESLVLSNFFMQRFAPFYVVVPIAALFALRYRPSARLGAGIAVATGALLVLQSVRDIDSDAGILSAIHLPLLLLSLAGAAALGTRWRGAEARTAVLQLIGEAGTLAALLLLGGGVLVGVTAGLFSAIGIEAADVLFNWVVVYGALGVLPVGVWLAWQRGGTARLAPLMARVFGPLTLAVLAVYLPALLLSGGLENRDSLLTLNAALAAVLGLVILIEAERPDVRRHWTDLVAAALVVLALAADAAAFVSIVERLAGGGITPNRLAIVGMNVLVAAHLAGLAVPLVNRAAGRPHRDGAEWTARFLNVHVAWAAVVVVLFPPLFSI